MNRFLDWIVTGGVIPLVVAVAGGLFAVWVFAVAVAGLFGGK